MFQALKKDRRRVQISFIDHPSMTEQSHKDEVDIQRIMRKFKKTGVLTHVAAHKGTYGDYASAPDYQEAQNIIANAKSLFESVPSHIRSDMDNDPQKFVDFMQNEDNRDAIEAYGLSSSHLPPCEEVNQTLSQPSPASENPADGT